MMGASRRISTRLLTVIVVLCAGAAFTAAQGRGGRGLGPARDAQVIASGTGSISGVVSLIGSTTPVRRAQVTLSGGGRGGRSTLTNDDGRFSFVALPAGQFTLNASKPGFATTAYGAKRPGRQGTPIQLADGQVIDNAHISLPRGAVITGMVLDEHGEPSPNTPVRAYRTVLQNGEPRLQSAGQDQTDDRGIYRVFQLLPGEYLVSAVPRNTNTSDMSRQLEAQLEPLLQQVQASGGPEAFLGVVAPGAMSGALGEMVGGGRGEQLMARIEALQQQLLQQPDQPTGYAPVYYPGTTSPMEAGKVTLDAGEERAGVDFHLQLVPTARVEGQTIGAEAIPPGSQVTLRTAVYMGTSNAPGLGTSGTRIGGDGTFAFQNVVPGEYRLLARVPVRDVPSIDENGQATLQGGRGGRAFIGRGRGGPISQVLWAASDISVNGQDLTGLTLLLQPGLTLSGRLAFESTTGQPPQDLSIGRVNVSPIDAQTVGGMTAQQVDALGNFSVTGIVPGRYAVTANMGGGGRGRGSAGTGQAAGAPTQANVSWNLKSAVLNGWDVLDFPLTVEPGQNLSGMVVTFSDRTQELTGTVQDALGRPTADYTIVLFPADNRYWVPRSRRIRSTRPSTGGTFSFRGFPAGQYRLSAVVDAEPGEWFDPAFLSQVVPASMLVSIGEGEAKVQDIRLAR
jgi:hypothetical protein